MHHRLRVHLPQHYVTTFCACGEFSYNQDYVLRHKWTMKCNIEYLFEVDAVTFPEFFKIICFLAKTRTSWPSYLEASPSLPNIASGSSCS